MSTFSSPSSSIGHEQSPKAAQNARPGPTHSPRIYNDWELQEFLESIRVHLEPNKQQVSFER
ncbi:hypothetical protein HYZ99_00190 [Candidatus Peregrinibacteria bacterium]|nr:hypothetical protein [Candidatus Peregrinibacteria bacterium]